MKRKIVVYTICKNEEQFVDRFMDWAKEADEVVILDTGSTDHTVSKLKKRGAKVTVEEIKPWRFDVARNRNLELIDEDTDICACVDLDEVLQPGWREEVEKYWTDTTTRMRYNYIWSFDQYGKPATSFYTEKFHAKKGYRWTHPVHEVLTFDGVEKIDLCPTMVCSHHPDDTKSRGQYLPLLELSVEEDPEDDRNMHYLGREYMFHGQWNDSIDTLIRHLSLKKATWKEERCASMRFIARSYKALKRYEEAELWLKKAILESPNTREPYVEMALLKYDLKQPREVVSYLDQALTIKERGISYINEPFCWDSTIPDLLAVAHFQLGNVEESYKQAKQAVELDGENKRLVENLKLIEEVYHKEKEGKA